MHSDFSTPYSQKRSSNTSMILPNKGFLLQSKWFEISQLELQEGSQETTGRLAGWPPTKMNSNQDIFLQLISHRKRLIRRYITAYISSFLVGRLLNIIYCRRIHTIWMKRAFLLASSQNYEGSFLRKLLTTVESRISVKMAIESGLLL